MLVLKTFGKIELERDGAAILTGRRKPLALLTYLARRRGRVSTRDELADLLWGVAAGAESHARQSLRQALSELRSVLGDSLVANEHEVRVLPDALEIDANLLETDVASANWSSAIERWQGDFLVGLDDLGGERFKEWLDGERPLFRQMASRAFQRSVDERTECADWISAVRTSRRWREAFPDNQQACIANVRALRASGRNAEAWSCYTECVATLQRDFGVAPTAELLRVAEGLERMIPSSAGTPGARALMTPDLVGRADTLAELTRAWQLVRNEGIAFVVSGDEGTGKSRLLRDWVRQIRSSRPRNLVIEARAFVGEKDHAFGTLRPILMQLAEFPELSGVSPDVLAALATVAPELRDVFRHLPSDGVAGHSDIDEQLRRVIVELCTERALLLTIDDAPEADPASARAIALLLRRPPKGFMLVLSGRADAWARSVLTTELERPTVALHRTTLSPLDSAQTLTLLASMVPLAPDNARTLAAFLHCESGGNPGQLTQLLAHLATEGHIAPDETGQWSLSPTFDATNISLPEELRDSFMARVKSLDSTARLLVEIASAMGAHETVNAATLEQLSELSGPSFALAIGDVLVARVLVEHARHGDQRAFEFQSAANQRAVYESLAPSRRRALHRAIYRVLRTPANGVRTQSAFAEYHRRLSGDVRWFRSWKAGVAALAIMATTLVGAIIWRARSSAVEPGTLALLADVHNITGDSLFAQSLYGAATVQLQQSHQIALVPRSRVAQALMRMRRQTDTTLSDALAREVAEREGVPIVISLGIARFDSSYALTVRLVEPQTGRDVHTDREVARRRADVLGALDRLLDRTRRALGESRVAIAASERSLPRVTTASLEALHAFADGTRAWSRRDYDTARDAWVRAVQLDSGFALAWSSLADIAYQIDSNKQLGIQYLDHALAGIDRLTEREQLILRAKEQTIRGSPEEAIRLRAMLAQQFPERENWYSLGTALMRARRCDEATPALQHALRIDSLYTNAWINLATCQQFVGRYDDAVKSYERAATTDSTAIAIGAINGEFGMALLHLGMIDSATAVYRRLAARQSPDDRWRGVRSLAYVNMMRGQYNAAAAELDTAFALASRFKQVASAYRCATLLAQVARTSGDTVRQRTALDSAWSMFHRSSFDIGIAAFGGLEFAKARQIARAQSVRDSIAAQRDASSERVKSLIALLDARMLLATGHADRARQMLKLATDTTLDGFRLSALVDTYSALRMPDSALVAAELLSRVMRLGDEQQHEWLGAPLRVAQLARAVGDTAKMRAAYSLVLNRWKAGDATLPAIVEAKRVLKRDF